MLKYLSAFTVMTRHLHLALGVGLIAVAFWKLPTNDALHIVFIATIGIALAYRELDQALGVVRSCIKHRVARHWPTTVAHVVSHKSYTYTSGSEDTEHGAVSITWAYTLQGRALETHTDIVADGKKTPEELAAAHAPIGSTRCVHADPTGQEGVVFLDRNGLPGRWAMLKELPELVLHTLLYLGYLAFTAWMTSSAWTPD